MKFNKGDKVKVTSTGGVYTTYLSWLCENKTHIAKQLPHWVYGRSMTKDKLDDEWKVIYSSEHLDVRNTLVFIDNGKEAYLTGEKSLVLCPEEKRLKWTDLKVGDVITDGETECMVISIDKSPDAIFRICVITKRGNDWFDDKDLEDWKKVN